MSDIENDLPPDLRLGVNVDHVATVRNARGGEHPCPVRAALMAEQAGADGITAHLREDRRHIRDEDMFLLKEQLSIPLNMEMAATVEMVNIAKRVQPHAVCLVPEKREELTTEGGLDVIRNANTLAPTIDLLADMGARVSLFIDPEPMQLDMAKELGAPVVELHTGSYCDALTEEKQEKELQRIVKAAKHAGEIGLECHAGHGLTYANVAPIARLPQVVELNIGQFLMGEAMFVGLEEALHRMRHMMDSARYRSDAA